MASASAMKSFAGLPADITYTTAITTTTMVIPPSGTVKPTVTLTLPPGGGIPTLGPNTLPNLEAKESPLTWETTLLIGWDPPTQIQYQILPAPEIASVSSSAAGNSTLPTASMPFAPGNSPTASLPSSSAPATNSTVISEPGVSKGAAAGIAIGCLIAGALIAGLLFWFCWRKRKMTGVRDQEASRTALMPAPEKGFAANAIPLGRGSSAASPVSAALPLPLEDKAITGEISKIANSIKNHVQSYYQHGRVSPGLVDVDDIHALGTGQPISAGTLSTLLGNTATREIALRFCIAWAVCSRMRPGADPKTSLLPQEVAGCVQSITPQKGGSSAQNTSALARWRVMTAELSQASYVREPFTNADSRNANIQVTLAALENILQPFADSRMDNGERKRNLEEILKRSALFAFTLFSQPSTWDFDWCEKQGVHSGELCIFPALLQLSDEHGQAVIPPRPFSEAVVRRLSE